MICYNTILPISCCNNPLQIAQNWFSQTFDMWAYTSSDFGNRCKFIVSVTSCWIQTKYEIMHHVNISSPDFTTRVVTVKSYKDTIVLYMILLDIDTIRHNTLICNTNSQIRTCLLFGKR